MRGRAWHAALQWELSVRSWDESATHGRKKRGEKTHTHLDRTKKYKCVITLGLHPEEFTCLKNRGLLNCGGFVQPRLTSRFLQLYYKRADYEWKQCWKWRCAGIYRYTGIYLESSLYKKTRMFSCCEIRSDSTVHCFRHIPSTPRFLVSHFSYRLIK